MKPLVSAFLVSLSLLLTPTLMLANTAVISGTVAETIDAGSYIYLRLEEPEMWIATSPFSVSEGDQVRFNGGLEMKNFHSKALDRTFDSIFFVQSVSTADHEVADMQHAVTQGQGTGQIADPLALQPPAAGELSPLKDGKTIAMIFSDAELADGQTISLRARVMKVSRNILGKNWITLQDGTGEEPENRLMATSTELVAPGDLVIVKGTLKNDVDIGAGYQYKKLLEQASFSVD